MTEFRLASFNVKNLIGAEQEYYRFERYTLEEHDWKQTWLARQLMRLNADVVCFQEIFDEKALRDVVAEADAAGRTENEANLPDPDKRYSRKRIFEKLAYHPYSNAELAFAANVNDGAPGARRPGLAILSRVGFAAPARVIQALPEPLKVEFGGLSGRDAGHFELATLSRPILRVEIPMGDEVVVVYNCHLKSKLGEFDRADDADFPPASDLVNYDPSARALGSLRAGLRRMAEAWVLRDEIVRDLQDGRPVIVAGDFNDGEHAVSTEIISGEAPFRNYSWLRRHDARHARDRYSQQEDAVIRKQIEAVRLYSAEKLFVRTSLRDMVYTSAFGGNFESIDQIFLSRHFHPETSHKIAEMTYFTVLNDHLTDASHPDAPYNKLASDHGQIMVHLSFGDTRRD